VHRGPGILSIFRRENCEIQPDDVSARQPYDDWVNCSGPSHRLPAKPRLRAPRGSSTRMVRPGYQARTTTPDGSRAGAWVTLEATAGLSAGLITRSAILMCGPFRGHDEHH
jgi:hypothetical protein